MRDGDRLAMVPVSLSGGVEPGARTGTTASGQVDLAAIARGAGIDDAYTAWTVEEFTGLCEKGLRSDHPFVIVVKVDSTAGQGLRRKHSDGREDKYIFVRHVEETEGIVIMGPSEHN